MDYINKLISIKESKCITEEDIKKLIHDESSFFRLPINVLKGILDFLEVPLDKMDNLISELLSVEVYKKSVSEQRIIMGKNQ